MRMRLAVMGLTLAAATVASAADLPRYKLEPGEVLSYRSTMSAHEQNGEESGSDGRTRIVVAGQNGDAWNLVIFSSDNYWRGKRPEATQPAEQDETLQKAVLHADGRAEPSDDARMNITGLFLPLPQKQADLTRYTADAPFGDTLTITPTEHSGKQWVLDVNHDSMENVIYIVTNHDKVTIDVERGLPIRIEGSFSQDYGFHQKGAGLTELQSVEKKDPAWAAQLWKDLDTFKQASAAYGKAEENLAGDEAAMKDQLKKARDAFQAARSNVKSPEVIAQIDRQVKQLAGYEKYEIQEALDQAKVLNQPAPDWTLEQVGGGKIALKDLRGKVILLDWWYRGCGWCMRAMPQVKQLAADYKSQGVIVLGMNVDQDPKDASFVIDKMGLTYPTLRASWDLAKPYGVHGYPTLVLIDQQGIIRKFHVGYSPTLRKDIGATLDTLLKGQPG